MDKESNNISAIIISSNSLIALGIKHLVLEIVPSASIQTFIDYNSYLNSNFYSESNYILSTLETNNNINTINIDVNKTENELREDIRKIILTQTSNYTPNSSIPKLTKRETEVLKLLTQGYIIKEIAGKLNISLHTAISHRKNISTKLGIKTISGLTIYAIMHNIV